LIIIFKDPEGFSLVLLSRLIEILAERKERFPVFSVGLVFLTHPLTGPPEGLSHRASSRLYSKHFILPDAEQVLNSFVIQLFGANGLPFMMSPEVLCWLRLQFTQHHYSLKTFLHQLEFISVQMFSQRAGIHA